MVLISIVTLPQNGTFFFLRARGAFRHRANGSAHPKDFPTDVFGVTRSFPSGGLSVGGDNLSLEIPYTRFCVSQLPLLPHINIHTVVCNNIMGNTISLCEEAVVRVVLSRVFFSSSCSSSFEDGVS